MTNLHSPQISGTAAKLGQPNAYHHCTLLVDSNKSHLQDSLIKNEVSRTPNRRTEIERNTKATHCCARIIYCAISAARLRFASFSWEVICRWRLSMQSKHKQRLFARSIQADINNRNWVNNLKSIIIEMNDSKKSELQLCNEQRDRDAVAIDNAITELKLCLFRSWKS